MVEHPCWLRPLRQVLGWAAGDVRCIDALPSCAFWAPPNWAVLALVSLALRRWAWAQVAVLVEVGFLTATYAHAVLKDGPRSPVPRAEVCVLSVLPSMLQDARRLASKLRRGRVLQLLQHFDWMDGQRDHVPATQFSLLIKFAATLLGIAAIEWPSARPYVATTLVLLWALWARVQGIVMPPLAATCKNPLALRAAARAPFVVLATQRTGSNMLCGLLHGVCDVHMHNELFNEKGVSAATLNLLYGIKI